MPSSEAKPAAETGEEASAEAVAGAEAEAEAEDGAPRSPRTFEGRFKLAEFMFSGGSGGSPDRRRSPRLAPPLPSAGARALPAPRGAGTSTSAAAASSPRKRRATSPPASPLASPPASPAGKKPRRPLARTSSTGSSSSKYASPSTYSHLPLLPDALAPHLLVLFIGLNPGLETARSGHAYAHPTNLFWRLLHRSGTTPVLCAPTEDRSLPARFALGLTNIVARPSRNGAELSRSEMDAGVAALEAKARRWRPEAVCVVGKSIWESLWRVRHGGRGIKKDEFRYGWQDEGENMGVADGDGGGQEGVEGVDYARPWNGARVFVAPSTSGLAATMKPAEKEEVWRGLGEWVVKRRAEREAAAAAAAGDSST
ncbi:uracil-DNA glycosylase-like protein [Lasiosphaeria ovina]|uniref:Uracil-DNA glycosylase-like protein n=1 Tax=Lasiosphaeria ovina TaxID=92902 RepID=A0AAE0TXG4_9PEZI|nr:uracil-DNA glycosylase-like protein [Lasiosphaeria ovina]